jgi:hypothetical protein
MIYGYSGRTVYPFMQTIITADRRPSFQRDDSEHGELFTQDVLWHVRMVDDTPRCSIFHPTIEPSNERHVSQ